MGMFAKIKKFIKEFIDDESGQFDPVTLSILAGGKIAEIGAGFIPERKDPAQTSLEDIIRNPLLRQQALSQLLFGGPGGVGTAQESIRQAQQGGVPGAEAGIVPQRIALQQQLFQRAFQPTGVSAGGRQPSITPRRPGAPGGQFGFRLGSGGAGGGGVPAPFPTGLPALGPFQLPELQELPSFQPLLQQRISDVTRALAESQAQRGISARSGVSQQLASQAAQRVATQLIPQEAQFGLQRGALAQRGALDLGRLGLAGQQFGLAQQLGLGRLGLGQQQFGLSQELGRGRLGLAEQLGFGQLGLAEQQQQQQATLDALSQFGIEQQRILSLIPGAA